ISWHRGDERIEQRIDAVDRSARAELYRAPNDHAILPAQTGGDECPGARSAGAGDLCSSWPATLSEQGDLFDAMKATRKDLFCCALLLMGSILLSSPTAMGLEAESTKTERAGISTALGESSQLI